MNAEDKIVFLDGQFPAIIFPVGDPNQGGSCYYMTDNCQKYCPCHEINEHEERALQYFKDNRDIDIIERIIKELGDYSFSYLYWFSWGDCPPYLDEGIRDIMVHLASAGVIQNGFTRNKALWLLVPNNIPNLKIGYHAETIEHAKALSKDRITCCPDVEKGKGELYFKGRKIARCCGIWCEWVGHSTRMADCQECYLHKQGCFFC